MTRRATIVFGIFGVVCAVFPVHGMGGNGDENQENLFWVSSSAQRARHDEGSMSITGAGASAKHLVAHFSRPEDPILLEPGQTIRIQFEFTPTSEIGESTNALRFGIFRSGTDSRSWFEVDGHNPDYVDSLGYVAVVHVKTGGVARIAMLKRNGLGRLMTNSSAYQQVTQSSGSMILETGVRYVADITLALEQDRSIHVHAKLQEPAKDNGCEIRYVDPEQLSTAFDLVGISIFDAISKAEISAVKISR